MLALAPPDSTSWMIDCTYALCQFWAGARGHDGANAPLGETHGW